MYQNSTMSNLLSFHKNIIYTLCLVAWPAYAQNLDMVGKEEPFTINGGLTANQIGYVSSDSISTRDPYSYVLSGNINMALYGWSVPLSFTYSSQQFNYTQPFNQYSIHPTYKWVKAHAGYTSMSISPYTLNGHLFLGAGVELSPTKTPFTLSAMYGRLKRAVEYDSTGITPTPPEFDRWGYGLNGTYKFSVKEGLKADLGLSVFKAKDNPNSVSFLPDSMVYPGENTVLGTQVDIHIDGGLNFGGELAASAVTQNVNSGLEWQGAKGLEKFMGNMARPNATTEVYYARKFHIRYGAKIFNVGVNYERIDPGYQTYGAYYFNNDMENITLNGSLRILKDKVNLGANVGKQRDDLQNTKASQLNRWVTAFNLAYSSGKKLSASASYSTFTSFMNIKSQFDYINQVTPYDNIDTLDFTQLSASSNANFSYALKSTEQVRQNLSVNISHQKASEKQGGAEVNGGSQFYNTNAAYSYSLVPLGLSISTAINASVNRAPVMHSSTFGPTLAVNKMFFDKKLRASLSCSYNTSYLDGAAQNRVLSVRGNSAYRLGKRHSFNLGITFLNRKTGRQEKERKYNELVATLGYAMSF